jgi:AraC-like DNA-binding protein
MIAVALPDRLAGTLQRVIPAEDLQSPSKIEVNALRAWLARVARSELCVFDPALLPGEEVFLELLRATLLNAGVRCVFYTTCTPSSMRAVVAAFGLQPAELWLAGFDDERPGFAERIQRLSVQQTAASLLRELDPPLSRLPRAASDAVRVALNTPERFFCATDLARQATLSRRHLDRYLVLAGLSTARRVVITGKVLHGVLRIRRQKSHGRGLIHSIAKGLGYSDARAFASHYGEVFGAPPSRESLPDDPLLVQRLATYVTRPGTMLNCSGLPSRIGDAAVEVSMTRRLLHERTA